MTKENIDYIKEVFLTKDPTTGKTLAKALWLIANEGCLFDTSKNFVVFDDSKELIHAIKPHTFDGHLEASATPFRMVTSDYNNIVSTEAFIGRNDFEKVIDEVFLSTGLITQEEKENMKLWAKEMLSLTSEPNEFVPYYNNH